MIADARRGVEEQGSYGVKLNGAQNGFRIDDPALAMRIIEAITRTGAVLALHVGADVPDQTHPSRVATIALSFPELRILVVHMGGVAFHDLSGAAIAVATVHPNIMLIGSAVRAISILRAIRTRGAGRVCFGSDTPFELMHVESAEYWALLDGEVLGEERDCVMGGNITELLGVKDGTRATPGNPAAYRLERSCSRVPNADDGAGGEGRHIGLPLHMLALIAPEPGMGAAFSRPALSSTSERSRGFS